MNDLDEPGRRLGELMRAAVPEFEPVRIDDLRRSGTCSRRRVAPLAAAVAAAAAVALLAVVLSLVYTSGQNHSHGASGTDELAAVLGYEWRVTQLVDADGTVKVPSSLNATIGFTRDGYVLGNDTVNALQSTYQPTSAGYTVGEVASTAVGALAGDPTRDRTIRAVDDMFFTVVNSPDQQPSSVLVEVTVHGDGLTLHRQDTTLTLQRAGVQPDFFTGPASATASGPVATQSSSQPQSASESVPPSELASGTSQPTGPATPTGPPTQGSTTAAARASLAPPDTTLFPAKGCGPDSAPIVTITINPDTPVPYCAIVDGSQLLRVVNATNAFNQRGTTITVDFAGLPERVLTRGQSTTYDQPFGSYLAPGEHYLRVSYYPGSEIVIWLK